MPSSSSQAQLVQWAPQNPDLLFSLQPAKFPSHLSSFSVNIIWDLSLFETTYAFLLNIHTHTHTHRGRNTGKGRSKLPMGTLMWDSILGPWNHNLSPGVHSLLTSQKESKLPIWNTHNGVVALPLIYSATWKFTFTSQGLWKMELIILVLLPHNEQVR